MRLFLSVDLKTPVDKMVVVMNHFYLAFRTRFLSAGLLYPLVDKVFPRRLGFERGLTPSRGSKS